MILIDFLELKTITFIFFRYFSSKVSKNIYHFWHL